jgi:5-methylcytosine-specific restriction enzyme A
MGRLAGRGLPSRLRPSKSRLRSAQPGQSRQLEAPRRSRNWYKTAEWQKLRAWVLQRDGYICQQTGVALIGKHPAPNAPVVDHIEPHRGDREKFFDPSNLQSVSKAWHDGIKQSMEKSGLV